jgi:hypothetical protein
MLYETRSNTGGSVFLFLQSGRFNNFQDQIPGKSVCNVHQEMK